MWLWLALKIKKRGCPKYHIKKKKTLQNLTDKISASRRAGNRASHAGQPRLWLFIAYIPGSLFRMIMTYTWYMGMSCSSQAHRAAGEERRRRLAISLATLSSKPEKRADVVANGGVAALTKLSRSEESRTRSSCAQVSLHPFLMPRRRFFATKRLE